MKYLILPILYIFSFGNVSAQDYTPQETKAIERYYFQDYKNIYSKAKQLLNAHFSSKQKKTKATQKQINVMAYRINEAFNYLNIRAFKQNKQNKEVQSRIKAIENACLYHGLYINPRIVNIEYNNLYGETTYAVYYKGSKKPKAWSKSKSKKVKTLKNTYVRARHSIITPRTLANQ